MQQINREQRQTSVRLARQLPANVIKETTIPIHNKSSKSAPGRVEKITGENQQQWSLRRWQTDLDEFDTHRSLSDCPTYLSLSRQSPETRECATQITTETPTELLDDNSEISVRAASFIDNNQLLLVDEIPVEEFELMPISSGFGNYPYNYPTTKTQRIVQPQIIARAPKFRDKIQNDTNGNSKTAFGSRIPAQRPTVVKQSPRSDVFPSPTRRNEPNPRVPKGSQPQNASRQPPPREPSLANSRAPVERRRAEPIRRNVAPQPIPRYSDSPGSQQDYGRKPVRLHNKHNDAYHPSSPPAYYQKSAPLPRNTNDRPRRMHVANNEYIIQRQTHQPAYDDYRAESPIERRSSHRVVRVVRDAPSYREEDDDVYYVQPAPRRHTVVRRPSPVEYVYIDETPPTVRKHRPRRRPEVVYVDEPPIEVEEEGDEYIYIDEDGNEVDFTKNSKHSPHYVEYYDDDKDKRRSHKSKVVYVEDDRNKKKSKHPSSSTRVVYE